MAVSVYVVNLNNLIRDLAKEFEKEDGPNWNRVKLKACELIILADRGLEIENKSISDTLDLQIEKTKIEAL
jgi:DNA replication protein DnaC